MSEDVTLLPAAGRHGKADGPAGVAATPITGLDCAVIAARRGRAPDVCNQALALYQVTIADRPVRAVAPGIAFVGNGPGRWLALARCQAGQRLADRLAREFAGTASVSDLSDAFLFLRLEGPRVRDALAKGVAIDLHPSTFKTNDAAATGIALVSLTLWQVDDAPAYELAIPVSYAASFWHWLISSGAEFGLDLLS